MPTHLASTRLFDDESPAGIHRFEGIIPGVLLGNALKHAAIMQMSSKPLWRLAEPGVGQGT